MVALSESRKDMIKHIFEKIKMCEGGTLDYYVTPDGDFFVHYKPGIPIELWCDDCLKRAKCKAKLFARWSGQRIL